MKSFVRRIGIALAVCAMTGVMAFAEVKSDKVTFSQDVTVNGTVVKKGTYKIMFDDQTSELTIAKDKNTVAKTKVTTEKRENKASRTEVNSSQKDNAQHLRSITFGGDNRLLVIGDGSTAASSQ
jgi:hypothetical protein